MTRLSTLFTTRDHVTHTDFRLIECTHPLGTKTYQVMIAQAKYKPTIRPHASLDSAIRDYAGTIAGEVSSLGSAGLARELEDFPRYALSDEPFDDAIVLPRIQAPVAPGVFT